MNRRLLVPATIEDNDAVRVLEWHVRPGERVEPGALIVEVETHKALIEIRAGEPGVLREARCGEGDWCPLGGVLAVFTSDLAEPLAEPSGVMTADFLIG